MYISITNILQPLVNVIPEELTLRDISTTKVVGLGLFIAFGLLAITKLLNKDVFRTLIIANYKGNSIEQYVKEVHLIKSGWSVVLIANYWVSFSLVGYVITELPGMDDLPLLLLVILIPIAWLLLSQLNLYLGSLLTGEYQTLVQFLYFRIVGLQLLGIVLFILCSFWTLTTMSSRTLLLLALIVITIEFFIRVFKSIIFARQKRISWYYIILYICTLETLPLLVFYYLVVQGVEV